MKIPKRTLGKTGEEVTVIGLGGEGVLRTSGYEKDAYLLINKAIDFGINYFESARAYSGSESYYGKALGERRQKIFLASKGFDCSRFVQTLKEELSIKGGGGKERAQLVYSGNSVLLRNIIELRIKNERKAGE